LRASTAAAGLLWLQRTCGKGDQSRDDETGGGVAAFRHIFHFDISCCREEPDVNPRPRIAARSRELAFTRRVPESMDIDVSASRTQYDSHALYIYV
jgi:hypothetical protein